VLSLAGWNNIPLWRLIIREIKEDTQMRKIIIACAAAITFGATLPASAEEVIVDGPSYDQGYRHHSHQHPYVALSDRDERHSHR
jgi:hypothetical protein